MRKFTPSIIAVVAGLTSVAEAQVTYTGYSESAVGVSAHGGRSYAGSIVAVLAAGQAGFTADDIYSFRINRGASSASATRSHFFSLETADLPVRLDLLTGLFDGKLVFGGGGLATDYTINLSGKISVFEYDDTNNNDKIRPDRSVLVWCATTGPLALASLTDNGLSLFDNSTTPLSNYILGAHTQYMLAVETSWAASGTAALTDPSVVITVEHQTPLFSGAAATFNYQTVPEPGTAALLASAAFVPLLRRRRS